MTEKPNEQPPPPSSWHPPITPELIQDLMKRKTWEDTLFHTPLVKKSYLWGACLGSMMMAHKLRLYKGNISHALSSGFLTFITVSSVHFVVSANEQNRKYDMIRQAFSQRKIKEDKTNRPT